MIWHQRENELKQFIDKFKKFHPNINFTFDYSRERVHFRDVQIISIKVTKYQLICTSKKRMVISTSINRRVTHTIVLSRFLIVMPYDSTEYVGIISYRQPLQPVTKLAM